MSNVSTDRSAMGDGLSSAVSEDHVPLMHNPQRMDYPNNKWSPFPRREICCTESLTPWKTNKTPSDVRRRIVYDNIPVTPPAIPRAIKVHPRRHSKQHFRLNFDKSIDGWTDPRGKLSWSGHLSRFICAWRLLTFTQQKRMQCSPVWEGGWYQADTMMTNFRVSSRILSPCDPCRVARFSARNFASRINETCNSLANSPYSHYPFCFFHSVPPLITIFTHSLLNAHLRLCSCIFSLFFYYYRLSLFLFTIRCLIIFLKVILLSQVRALPTWRHLLTFINYFTSSQFTALFKNNHHLHFITIVTATSLLMVMLKTFCGFWGLSSFQPQMSILTSTSHFLLQHFSDFNHYMLNHNTFNNTRSPDQRL